MGEGPTHTVGEAQRKEAGAWTPSSSSVLQEEIINSPEELKQPLDRFCSPRRQPGRDPQPGSEPSGSPQSPQPSLTNATVVRVEETAVT